MLLKLPWTLQTKRKEEESAQRYIINFEIYMLSKEHPHPHPIHTLGLL
jgi:hypothetical protein